MTRPGATLPPARYATSANAGSAPAGPVGGSVKRVFDICAASLVLLLLSPMLLMTALLIMLSMGGPVLFAQPRVGLNGRGFRRYKFRAMVNDTEARRHPCKHAHDPRVTTLGQILRKTRIDELPQLINVLRGDMSCVGPQPVSAADLERYGAQAADYLKTRPGLTGLWQVSGRNSPSCANRVVLDGLYIRNWSLLLDLAILVRTIGAALKFNQTA